MKCLSKKECFLICLMFFIFYCLNVFAKEAESCLVSCVRQHPLWGAKSCRETDFFIEGPGCYEVFSGCLQQCGKYSPKAYIPSQKKLTDQWRQGTVCDSEITKIPLDLMPGTYEVDPQWSGRCECANSRLIEAPCGHRKASCQQVCNTDVIF
ncbi:MAG: hypothetical protein HQM11_14750 [SAR324 cluster bacterium]|nr:hypothetical protein [SAR324 cluster bacterium]